MKIVWAVCAMIVIYACGCSITPKGQTLITPSQLTRAVVEEDGGRAEGHASPYERTNEAGKDPPKACHSSVVARGRS